MKYASGKARLTRALALLFYSPGVIGNKTGRPISKARLLIQPKNFHRPFAFQYPESCALGFQNYMTQVLRLPEFNSGRRALLTAYVTNDLVATKMK
jgi:hypothetical protein